MYVIKKFLTEEETSEILSKLESWKQGHTNAGTYHKNNSELENHECAQLIAQKIQQHPYAGTRWFLKRLTLPRFNKYDKNQHYSRHVDSFKQQGVQTDWSYTLMLQPAELGGDLAFEIDGQHYNPKLEAGDIVVYHSGNIHQVTPVEQGTRIAAIGWMESLMARPEERLILGSLIDVMQDLDRKPEHKEHVLKLTYSYHNLLRLWSK